MDGFPPLVGTDLGTARRRAAIVEFGLPYPADPAISRPSPPSCARHGQVSRGARDAGTGADPEMPTEMRTAAPICDPRHLAAQRRRVRADAISARLEAIARSLWRGAPARAAQRRP